MGSKNLNISYFGNRTYIDVSTLTSALYQAVPDITENSKITAMNGRLLKKITHECALILGEENFKKESNKAHKNLVATFDWLYEGQKKEAYFIHQDALITSRRPEILEEDLGHYLSYSDGEVTIIKTINGDSIYNFMKMGRLLSTNKFGIAPRVVKFHFDRLFNEEEMKGIVMTGRNLFKKDFCALETFYQGKKFGEIIIKSLPLD